MGAGTQCCHVMRHALASQRDGDAHAEDDPFHVSTQDREVDAEMRWQTIGMVGGIHILLIAHTLDEEEQLVRISSARKATPQERRIYAEGF